MRKIFSCLFVLASFHFAGTAQQVVSSGGYEVKSGITVDWILGGSLSDLSVNDESSFLKAIEEKQLTNDSKFKVYPVPASDFVNIETGIADTSKLDFEILNDAGITIFRKRLNNIPVLRFDLSGIPAGVYILKVSSTSPEQIFGVKKIIKNK